MPGMIFQHDNSPCHNNKTIKQYFDDQNIPVLQWPAQSPDLNITENVWSFLSDLVYANGKQYQSKNELEAAVIQSWNLVNLLTIQRLYISIPKRLVECLCKKGAETIY